VSTDFAGPVLATLQGQQVILAKRLGSGGQGEVFALVEPDGYVLKRYFDAEIGRDPSLPDRLTVMANAMPARTRSAESDHILLAWPTDLVESGDHFIGYLMPLIDRSKTLPLHRVANPSDGRRSSSTSASRWARHIDWSYLVTAAANLALALQVLHQAGVVIGDFNENNVLVWRDARVTLLDCDSMQITAASGRHYLCRVGRAEFTPPELFRANWGHTVRAPSSDLFALAIHIHQLIMEGEHPFRGVWSGPDEKPTGQDLALEGVWAYGGDPRLRPRPRAVSNEILSPEIQALFSRAFADGAVNPRARPSAQEWNQALLALLKNMTICETQPQHHYRRELNECPWCRHEKNRARQMALMPSRPRLAPAPVAAPTGSRAASAPMRRAPAVTTGSRRRRLGLRNNLWAVAVACLVALVALTYIGVRTSQLDSSAGGHGPTASGARGAGHPSPTAAGSALAAAPPGPATTVACPTESPQAQVTVTASNGSQGSQFWNVTAKGTATNTTDASIEVFDVSVQLNVTAVSGGRDTVPAYLYGEGGTPIIVGPGQTVTLSDDGGDPAVASATEPTAGVVTINWNWPADSPYQRCAT
jgi:serine/threonine protein kinase